MLFQSLNKNVYIFLRPGGVDIICLYQMEDNLLPGTPFFKQPENKFRGRVEPYYLHDLPVANVKTYCIPAYPPDNTASVQFQIKPLRQLLGNIIAGYAGENSRKPVFLNFYSAGN